MQRIKKFLEAIIWPTDNIIYNPYFGDADSSHNLALKNKPGRPKGSKNKKSSKLKSATKKTSKKEKTKKRVSLKAHKKV